MCSCCRIFKLLNANRMNLHEEDDQASCGHFGSLYPFALTAGCISVITTTTTMASLDAVDSNGARLSFSN